MKRNASVAARFCAMTAVGLMGYGCSSGSTSDDGGTPSGVEGGTDGSQVVTTDAGQEGSTDAGRDGTTDGGQGGGTDGGRDGAADGGQGSPTDGGEGGAADASEGGVLMCSPAPADMSSCNANPPCTETCGVNVSALTTSRPLRTCTCSGSTASGGKWSCPGSAGGCVYPTDIDLTCFQLPTPLPACTLGTSDGGSADGGSADGGSADSGLADGGSSLIRTNSSPCTLPSSEVCGGVCGSATSTTYLDSTGAAKAGYCVCLAGIWQCASVSEWPTFGGG